jgi:hypothetical protein
LLGARFGSGREGVRSRVLRKNLPKYRDWPRVLASTGNNQDYRGLSP